MKTFEERYTEWIDGQLAGADLAAFERELARRAAVGDAQADKAEALAVRGLLREHLDAPVLSNGEFFNHQLRERMTAERALENRSKTASAAGRASWFGWTLPRVAWAGAAAAFVAVALYYGMIPPQQPAAQSTTVAKASVQPAKPLQAPAATEVAIAQMPSPEPAPTAAPAADKGAPVELALLNTRSSPAPSSLLDLQVETADETVSVTPMKIAVPHDKNVQVLWFTGLPYLPDAPAPESPAAPDNGGALPQPAANPAPPPNAH